MVAQHKHAYQRSVARNSSIEMLRIFAMLLIVLNHGLQTLPLQLADPWVNGVNNVLMNFGGVGDNLFFMITVWFLTDEIPSMKKSVLRVYNIEKQVLFWSISLFLAVVIVRIVTSYHVETKKLAVLGLHSFLPTVSSLWWYTSSYILFLLVFPWIQSGLTQLNRQSHFRLAILLSVVYYIIPVSKLWAISDYSVVSFIILYIVFSYIKRYRFDLLKSTRIAKSCIAFGLVAGILSLYLSSFVTHSGMPYRDFMNLPTKLPSLCIAFGLVSFAVIAKPWHSQLVNSIASTMLASYLVLTYPVVLPFVIDIMTYFGLAQIGNISLLINIIVCIVIFMLVSLLDLLRQHILFKHFLCRKPNANFVYVEAFASRFESLLLKKY